MLADNLENILKTINVNDFPQEITEKNKVSMEFPSDMMPFFQDGVENVSYLKNAVTRMTPNFLTCELRECVEGVWFRVLLTVQKAVTCRVSLEILGKEEYSADKGFLIRGDVK